MNKPGDLVASLRRPVWGIVDPMWGPLEHTDWIDESLSWKETCYIGDWTYVLYERLFRGPDALRLFADTSVNSMSKFDVGQSKHIIQCNADGKIIDDGILTRLGESTYVAFGTAALYAEFMLGQGDYDAEVEHLSLFKYHVQGPKALEVVELAAGENLRDIRFMRNRKVTIGGHEVTALRQGMSGELGFELQGPREVGPDVYDAILEAGRPFGIRRMGARVAMLNHLEANYPTATLDYMPAIFDDGQAAYRETLAANATAEFMDAWYHIAGSFESDDIRDWYRSPIELGWGGRINFDHEFIGDEALRQELESPRRTIVTLVWNSDDVIASYASLYRKDEPMSEFMEMPREQRGYMWADRVQVEDRLVGVTTSRGFSAYFREMLSLCTIDLEFSEPGTQVVVVWGNPGRPQREIRATVAPAPYKENRSRVDLSTLP